MKKTRYNIVIIQLAGHIMFYSRTALSHAPKVKDTYAFVNSL